MTETQQNPDEVQPPRHPRRSERLRIEGGGEWAPDLGEDNLEADLYLTKVNIETWLQAGLSKEQILVLYNMDVQTYEFALKAKG